MALGDLGDDEAGKGVEEGGGEEDDRQGDAVHRAEDGEGGARREPARLKPDGDEQVFDGGGDHLGGGAGAGGLLIGDGGAGKDDGQDDGDDDQDAEQVKGVGQLVAYHFHAVDKAVKQTFLCSLFLLGCFHFPISFQLGRGLSRYPR